MPEDEEEETEEPEDEVNPDEALMSDGGICNDINRDKNGLCNYIYNIIIL